MRKGTCRRLVDVDARRVLTSLCKGFLVFIFVAMARGQAPSPPYRAMGTVVSIEPTGFTIQTDSGTRLAVLLPNNATLLKVAPNQKDLKSATRISAGEISVSDRILVRGHISDDQKTLLATAAIVMSKADIAQKQEAERTEWQRGVGGLVSSIDPVNSTITISTAALGANKKVVIHLSKDTILRRYAPDSVRFDDAKPGALDQIKPGDQLRARGTRSEDGSEFAAEEIVSGSFRNIAGTVSSIDTSQNTLTVTDLKTKKPVLVKFTPDSQLRKLDPTMAQGIAMRLKGGAAGGPASGGTVGAAGAARPAGPPPSAGGPGGPPGGPGGARPGGAPDFQRLLSRLPQATLADLKKGDAVMIVATQGTDSGGVTVITLLSGVEPILTASPSASQAMFNAGWNLSGPPGGGGEEGTQ